MSDISAFSANSGIALRLAQQEETASEPVSDAAGRLSVVGQGGLDSLYVSPRDPGLDADAIEHAFFAAMCVEHGGG